MMDVRIVRVRVHQPGMVVPVRVGLTRRIKWPVRVLMVRIVNMPVLMRGRFMDVPMLVSLRDVEIQADRHQPSRDQESWSDGIAKRENRN